MIVPCYNAERYLPECLDSLVSQITQFAFEVIAINDGSTDATASIIDQYSKSYESIIAVHQENKGFSGARNKGIKLARGEVFVFVDSDDVMEPDALEVLVAPVVSGECDFSTANYRILQHNGQLRELGPRSHGAPWGRAYSRSIWEKICFPEGLWFEDTIQAYLINAVYSEKYIEHWVYQYRANPESITAKCATCKKSVDSYWIIETMLRWMVELGIEIDQRLYEQTLKQFGPLAYVRTLGLEESERKVMFYCCCGLFGDTDEFANGQTEKKGAWKDIEKALRTYDFQLWSYACSAV